MDGNETETWRSIGGNTQGTYRSFDTRYDNMIAFPLLISILFSQ